MIKLSNNSTFTNTRNLYRTRELALAAIVQKNQGATKRNHKWHSRSNHNVTEASIYATAVEALCSCQNNEQQQNHTSSVLSNQHLTEKGDTSVSSTPSQWDGK